MRTLAMTRLLAVAVACALIQGPARADDPPPKAGTVSFMKDVAPILVQNCIACHNPKKNESKYVMTTFAQLAKGGSRAKA
jgi:hypothetical protein